MSISNKALYAFVTESNMIEGILRKPTDLEINASRTFLDITESLVVADMIVLVKAYQPNAFLRDKPGMNVMVGAHRPIDGGYRVPQLLQQLLDSINERLLSAYDAHRSYETLHPFIDGNGRSGRMLWLKQMRTISSIGFLHTWYYQSLQVGGRR